MFIKIYISLLIAIYNMCILMLSTELIKEQIEELEMYNDFENYLSTLEEEYDFWLKGLLMDGCREDLSGKKFWF